MVSVVYLSNFLAHEHSGDSLGKGIVKPEVDPKILAIPGVSEKLAEWHSMAETIAHASEAASHR
jgi:hypothetical protein